MRVLVACEYSGVVRDAFRALGHDAMSCDLLPTEAPGPHHIGDVTDLLGDGWDLMIAHPPCTDLAVSGARWFPAKRADGSQQRSLDFVRVLMDAPIPRIAVENPVSIISSRIRKPDQIIQPWQFGHGEVKATCLWLKNLPALTSTDVVEGREARVHRMAPGPDRWERPQPHPVWRRVGHGGSVGWRRLLPSRSWLRLRRPWRCRMTGGPDATPGAEMRPGLAQWLSQQPDRCPHGYAPEQGCTQCGLAAKSRGQSIATTAHPEDRAKVEAAIRQLAASGKPFSANEARLIHGVRGGVVGATFTALKNEGVIKSLGDVTSTDKGTHGHRIFEWVAA